MRQTISPESYDLRSAKTTKLQHCNLAVVLIINETCSFKQEMGIIVNVEKIDEVGRYCGQKYDECQVVM